MDRKKINTLLFIAGLGLLIAGIIFLLVTLLSDHESEWVLPAALGCVLLGNLFNLIRNQMNKRNQSEKE